MISPTDHQFEGIDQAAEWYEEAWGHRSEFQSGRYMRSGSVMTNGQAFTFCGYAGSGKTTCVPVLIDEMGLRPEEVAFMAPTGKAAKVLSRKLQAAGMDVWARTAHKVIYIPRKERADHLIKEIADLEKRKMMGEDEEWIDIKLAELDAELEMALEHVQDSAPSFILKRPDELPDGCKLFVIDEASMVGAELADDLATFGIPILAIGDPGQLPPPASTWGFNLHSPDFFLTEIHRQAADNPIIRMATHVREGGLLDPMDWGDGVRVVKRRNDDVTMDMERDLMVLVGRNITRWQLTKKIRGAQGISSSGPTKGEPLIVCRNSKDYPSMVNGSLMVCETDHGEIIPGNAVMQLSMTDEDTDEMYPDVECAQAIFEENYLLKKNAASAPKNQAYKAKINCEHVDFGHVLTAHKAQGSEWDEVVVHDESGIFRDQAERWMYTAVTRAAKRLTVVVN